MFLRRLYSSQKYIKRAKIDPGVRRRRKAVQTAPDEVIEMDLDDLETDFMTVHKSHKEHLDELEATKEREKFLIVRDKYFKEKYPNFLSWNDKEQIRFLHNSDPDEWTIERLSEGFPALSETIQKVVKNRWTKKNQAKIINHDKGVEQNWNDFRSGKLENLPSDLKEHLKKFTARSVDLKTDNRENVVNLNKQISGEFSEIITSFQKLKEKTSTEVVEVKNEQQYNSFKRQDKRLLTLDELRHDVRIKAEKGKFISDEEKLLLDAKIKGPQESVIANIEPEDLSKVVESRHSNNKIGFVKKDVSHLIYPEKITIPKKIYKKGYTYKLNDCYYDSDGEFLYRVPGMG